MHCELGAAAGMHTNLAILEQARPTLRTRLVSRVKCPRSHLKYIFYRPPIDLTDVIFTAQAHLNSTWDVTLHREPESESDE
jgi:hypothetical protein